MFGTGAFSSLTAERNADVVIANDRQAFLALRPGDGPNSEYVSYHDDTSLSIDLDQDAPRGRGLNDNASIRFRDLFTITNNGTQEVLVTITDQEAEESNGANLVSFDSSATPSDDLGGNFAIQDPDRGVPLGVGETISVHMLIKTWDKYSDYTAGDQMISKMTIEAEATNGT